MLFEGNDGAGSWRDRAGDEDRRGGYVPSRGWRGTGRGGPPGGTRRDRGYAGGDEEEEYEEGDQDSGWANNRNEIEPREKPSSTTSVGGGGSKGGQRNDGPLSPSEVAPVSPPGGVTSDRDRDRLKDNSLARRNEENTGNNGPSGDCPDVSYKTFNPLLQASS